MSGQVLPPLSVNEAMTPNATFAEDLANYSEAGVDAIGITLGAIAAGNVKVTDDREALAQLRASGLRAGFCIPGTTAVLPRDPAKIGVLAGGLSDPEQRTDAMIADMRRLAAFDPVCCICIPGPVGSYEPEQARELAVAGLRRLARAAADVGVTLAMEPMHSSLGPDFSMITTLPDAVAMVDEIGEPNVGILADVWHLWDTPDIRAHLRAHARRLVGVHLDDRRDPTRSWCDRTLPGDGVADVPAFLRALHEGGYDGWFEFEVLSDDGTFGNDFEDSIWRRDAVEVIRAGREWFRAAWPAAATPA
jgi:sugar phosphate isomerase/epimerase